MISIRLHGTASGWTATAPIPDSVKLAEGYGKTRNEAIGALIKKYCAHYDIRITESGDRSDPVA